MGKKFLSFLGASNYTPSTYTLNILDKNDSKYAKYTQVVLLEKICNQWDESAKGFIFVTQEAKRVNWDDVDENNQSLQKEIKKLKEAGTIKFEIEAVEIPDGFSEQDIWKIFEIVVNHIDEEDEIVFDITHGYRYLPMLIVVMLSYLKTVKNINILGIYYGLFEVKDSNKPILNFTPFIDLLDLSFGVSAFLHFGDGSYLENTLLCKKNVRVKNEKQKLIQSGLDIKIAEKEIEKMFTSNEWFKGINDLISFAKSLRNFTDSIFTLRGRCTQNCDESIFAAYKDLREKIEKVQNLEADYFKPLKLMVEKIKQKTQKFENADNLVIGEEVIKWCKEYSFIAEGYVALEETMITYLCRVLGVDENDSDVRKSVSAAATKKSKQKNEQIETKNIYEVETKENEKIHEMAKSIPIEIAGFIERIKVKRNSVMHFGFTKDRIESGKIIEDFEELVEKALKLLSQTKN